MSLPFFAGSAAQSHADTTLKWRQIWSAEDRADKDLQLEKERMTFQAGESEKTRLFNERLAKENWDRTTSWETGKMALEMMPNMTLEQQISTYENFKSRGHIITPLLENSLNTGFYNNWEDAANMVDSLFTAEPGTQFTPFLMLAAAEQVANRMGIKGEDREAYMGQVNDALAERAKEGDEWNAMKWEGARTSIAQGRANLDQTVAETGQTNAHTSGLWQDQAIKEEQRDTDLRIRAATASKLESEAGILAIQEGRAGELLDVELADAWANVRDLDNRHNLFIETFDSMVRQAAAAADMDEEDVRHAMATRVARDALVNADGTYREEQLMAAIAATRAGTSLSLAQENLVGQQAINEELRGRATRIDIATMLAESGQTELLRSLSQELLGDFIPEGDLANVTDDLVQISVSRRSEGDKARATAARLATAEADYAEWRSETANEEQLYQRHIARLQVLQGDRQLTQNDRTQALADARFEFEQEMERAGLSLDEQRLTAYIKSLNPPTPTPGGGAGATSDIRERIKNDWGLNIGSMTTDTGTLGRVTVVNRDAGQIKTLTASLAGLSGDPGEAAAVRARFEAEIQVLADRYGMTLSPELMMDPEALAQAVGQLIDRELETTQSVAVGQLSLYIRAWMSEGGGIPTAQDIGLAAGDPLFVRALSNIEGFSDVSFSVDGIQGDVEQTVWDYLTTMGEGGLSSARVEQIYNGLVRRYGQDGMNAAGFTDEGTILRVVDSKNSEMNQLFSQADQLVGLVGSVMGVETPLSADNSWDVQTALSEMPLLLERGQNLQQDLDDLSAFWQEVGGHGLFGANAEVQRKEYAFVQSIIAMGIPSEVLERDGVFTPQATNSQWSFDRAAAARFVSELNRTIAQGTESLIRYEGVLALRNSSAPESEDSE